MLLEIEFGGMPPAQTLNRIERFAQFIDCDDRRFIYEVSDREDTIILLRLLWNRNDVKTIIASQNHVLYN